MQSSIIVRISGGGAAAKRSLAYVLYLFIRILKNLIPFKSVRRILKPKQRMLYRASYNFVDVRDYINTNSYISENYLLDKINVYVLNDFFISFDDDDISIVCYMHKGRNILSQSCAYPDSSKLPTFYVNFKKDVEVIDEAVNFALYWNDNYWHFTYTVLDKIFDFEKQNFRGLYILPDKDLVRKLIDLTDIPRHKIIFANKKKMYLVRKLHVLEYIFDIHLKHQDYYFTPALKLKEIRNRILSNIDLSEIHKYPKRLYVKRIGRRKVKNEDEVLERLKALNFEVMIPEDYSIEEQIKHFHAADIVICPHGAGSANCLYMREGTNFIECFGFNYVCPCCLDVIKLNSLKYNMLVESGSLSKDSMDSSAFVDYNINIFLLESVLYSIINL